MNDAIIVANAGSSSPKFSIYAVAEKGVRDRAPWKKAMFSSG